MNVFDASNACSKQEPSADNTGVVCNVRDRIKGRDTTFGAITEAVLFGVNSGLFVSIAYDGHMIASR